MFGIWPHVPFSFFPEPPCEGKDVRMNWIRLRGPLAPAYLEAMGFTLERPVFRARDPARVRKYMEELRSLAENHGADADARAVALLHLMLPACRLAGAQRTPRRTLAVRVKAAMEREVQQGMNVEELCRTFGVSRATLYLRFREEFGRSPVEVLIDTRVERAKLLLAHTGLPAARIAAACGYRDPLYFSRQFKERVGLPPGKYRERIHGGTPGTADA
jgi:AraC-like DNA-binding protein